jgi:glutathionylspermidine synthase
MKRVTLTPRLNWEQTVKNLGLQYWNQAQDGVYWNESNAYVFTAAEVDKMYYASKELFNLCMQAIDKIIENDWFSRFGIDHTLAQAIVDAWDDDAPTLYGRFDLTVGADGNYKMLEFNADTPTGLFEASIVQWQWKEDVIPQDDQFNALHGNLVEQFKYIKGRLPDRYGELYFTSVKSPEEDVITTQYIMAAANEAGLNTRYIVVDDIGFDGENFVDEDNYIIRHMFKLYPWEWLLGEQFGPLAFTSMETWIEPVWKLLLTNKAILPILWELFPNHPNLLPAYFYTDEASSKLTNKVIKPFYSREGCNITVKDGSTEIIATDGMYGDMPKIEQEFCRLPSFSGETTADMKYACLGSWIIGDEPSGLGIRESDSMITRNESKFVPHYIEG